MEYVAVNPEDFEVTMPQDFEGAEDADHARGRGRARRKARKSKRKARKVTKRAARKTKKTARKAKRKEKRKLKGKPMERVILAPLVPLKPVMKKALANRGINLPEKAGIPIIAKEFYNKVVVPGSGNTFEEVSIDFDHDNEHAIGVTLSAVASAIVTFIKGLKKKKEDGEPLSKTEEIVVTGTEKVEEQIQEKAREEAAREVGSKILFDKNTQIMIIGVVVAVVAIAFALKRK